ncbi:PEPxxWA-CTERM sorting domain-containing protein [Phenylobacterium sp.]|uniref:PEPxxWA-CTERM sorting domain-containing protein n=1 Tax=Phenylobacterium sp. TaxID=1871053 RepID=UPI00374D5EBA
MRSYKIAALGAVAVLGSLATSSHAAIIDFTTLQLNGGFASATATTLRLNNGSNLLNPLNPNSNAGEASSAFISTAFSTSSTFSTSFTFSLTNSGYDPQGDGITFLIQNDPAGASALGGGGGGVGANGLAKNIGVGFQSWDNNHVGIFTDGSITGTPDHNFNLGDQNDLVDVTIGYSGGILSYSAFNHVTGLSINDSQAFDLTSLGSSAYIGFTGGTGLSYSIQDVTKWDLTVTPNGAAVPEPETWALMLAGFGGLGAILRRRRAALAAA